MATGHNQRQKKVPLQWKLVVGAAAGFVGTCCIFPLDAVKTRLQADGGRLYRNPIHCAIETYKSGGITAFYKGITPNLIGVIFEKGIKLASNEYIREMFEKPDGSIELKHEIISGAGAGFIQVIATNPMEITKIRMQLNASLPPAERKTLPQVVRGLGLKGMYRGTLATLSRDVPFSVIFFPGYANLKKFLANERGENSILSLLAAGGISGAVSAGLVTPTDVVKTKLQMKGGQDKYKNMLTAARIILKEDGIKALFKGTVPRMMVVGPLFAITLLSFEAQKDYMIRHGLL